jgi:hypothetical protein
MYVTPITHLMRHLNSQNSERFARHLVQALADMRRVVLDKKDSICAHIKGSLPVSVRSLFSHLDVCNTTDIDDINLGKFLKLIQKETCYDPVL